MADLVRVSEVFERDIGDTVRVRGWIYRTRKTKSLVFIVLRDSSGIVQTTIIKDETEGFVDATKALIESSLWVEGEIVEDGRAPGGREIRADRLEIVGFSEAFPISKDKSDEWLLDIRHLWLRSRDMTSIFKIRSTFFELFRDYFLERGYYEVHAPIFVGGAVEGGSTLFEVNYYDRKVYLSQSWQLYAEAMMYGLENIFTIAPTFRAEKSRTRRHMTEFWMAEVESAWLGNEEMMAIEEEMLVSILEGIVERHGDDLERLGRDVAVLEAVETPFERMRYAEVLDELRTKGIDLEWGGDLGYTEEKVLTDDRTKPLFITHFPREKGFYHRPDPEDPRCVLTNDLLAPEGYGEIIGAGERIADMDVLVERIAESDIPAEAYDWYMDLRKYGTVQHSGFGLGVERTLAWITGNEHIRNMIPFPRTMRRVTP